MKKTTKFMSILTVTASVLLLTGCGNNQKSSKNDSKQTSMTTSDKSAKEDEQADLDYLTSLNALADKGVATKLGIGSPDFHNFQVGANEKIKPGIYDITVNAHTAFIERKSKNRETSIKEFWDVSAKDSGVGAQKTIRLILEEGDTLSAKPIVPGKVSVKLTPSKNKLSQLKIENSGDLIVGRDLEAGDYEISANTEVTDEDSIDSWKVSIYNHREEKSRTLTANKQAQKIELHDGEVMTVIHGGSEDKTERITLKRLTE